jgi:hypothetical protein
MTAVQPPHRVPDGRDAHLVARADLRARARRLGVLAAVPASAVDPVARRSAIEAMSGIGPVIDRIIADGR